MSAPREQVALEAGESWPVEWEPVEGDRDGPIARLETLCLRAVLPSIARLPWGAQRAVVRSFARLAKTVDRRHTHEARVFIEAAFGTGIQRARREQLVLDAYETLILNAVEGADFDRVVPAERRKQHFSAQATGDLRRVLDEGTGALMLTAHIGAWEYLPMVMADLGFRPIYAVSRPPRNRPLSHYIQRVRESRGFRLLARHGAAATIPKVIAAGGYVGLLVDQRARRKTIVAPFFGRPAHCERAVAIFARRLGVPVVFMACYRTHERWQYHVEFPCVLWPDELARRSPEEITARINVELERMIRAHPEQYFWLHDRYRAAPTDEEEA
jgi:Kdo2-lipid IVA lauroyltransferase/acyltransferase